MLEVPAWNPGNVVSAPGMCAYMCGMSAHQWECSECSACCTSRWQVARGEAGRKAQRCRKYRGDGSDQESSRELHQDQPHAAAVLSPDGLLLDDGVVRMRPSSPIVPLIATHRVVYLRETDFSLVTSFRCQFAVCSNSVPDTSGLPCCRHPELHRSEE